MGYLTDQAKEINILKAQLKAKDDCITDMMKEIDNQKKSIEFLKSLLDDAELDINNHDENIEYQSSVDRVEKINDLALKLMALPNIKPSFRVHKAELYRWYIQQAKIFTDVLFEEM